MLKTLRRHKKIIIAFLAIGLFVYGPSIIGNSFVNWDDYNLILENPVLQTLTLSNIWAMFSMYDPDLYIPLTFLSYQAERIIGGGEFIPWISHLINLLLHIGSALLIVGITSRMSKNSWIGVMTGLLFLVHPLHTEAVAWASARKDVLATMFFLMSIWWYQKKQIKISVGTFVLALLSKVIAITLPVALLLIDWREGRKIDKHCLKEKIPYFALSLVFGVIAIGGKTDAGFHMVDKMLIGVRSIMFYLEKIFVPMKLAVLYPFTEAISISNPELALSAAGVVGISIIAFLTVRRTKEIAFAWIFFLVTVFPTLTNFTKGDNMLLDVYIASDRYAYIPSIAILFLAATVLYSFKEKFKRFVFWISVVVVMTFGFLSYHQSKMWRDTSFVFLNVIQHYDNSHHAHNSVGVELENRGYIELAKAEYEKSLSIRPNEKAHYNLGRIYA
ncbi:MAG: hypothetical protein QF815_03770, partial [Candidatus Peribacteraceae bacterium]|nr:hypothetical protein [Candidatus Peribacteraceae bacterium]